MVVITRRRARVTGDKNKQNGLFLMAIVIFLIYRRTCGCLKGGTLFF